jgi:DNA-binding MarR family transcriptional regulator
MAVRSMFEYCLVVAARTDPVQALSADLAAVVSAWCRLLAQEGVHVNRTWLSVLATLTAGPRRLGDLAASEFVSQPGMTMLVSRLEGEGWVVRQPHATDGRVVNVRITPAGRRMLRSAIEARDQVLRRRIEHLGPEERRELEHAVAALERLRCGSTSDC